MNDASGTSPEPAGAAGRDVIVAIEGAAASIMLNRPRALNALTTAMKAEMAAAFRRWGRDPQVYAVVIASAVDRAFCAGGDLREMVEWGRSRPADARRSLAEEYTLNWILDCFTKPTVSLIDGVVVGSGVGITLYGTHRVGGERYSFAMPETGIGLFPDVGVAWAFARLPGEIGMYLALTGRSVGRADAYRLRLLTHCIPAAQFPAIRAAIADADPVDPTLDDRHVDPGPGEMEALEPAIARCFAGDSVEDILGRLEAERGEHRGWAEEVARDLRQRSPTSLKVTYAQVRRARELDLHDTLLQDYRLVCRFLEGHDLYEGVRANLIDRDRAPKWRPATLGDVSDAAVAAHFAPLESGDLALPTRAEMQAVRG